MWRKTLILSLMVIHLTGNTELGQLLKLPVLIAHYHQHREEIPSLTFFSFLVMHYAGDDGTKADDATDRQLPCHNLRQNTFATPMASVEPELPSFAINAIPREKYNSFIQIGSGSKHVFQHLQPPRIG